MLHAHYQRLVTIAKRDGSLTDFHSVEETEERHRAKARHPKPVADASPAGGVTSPAGTPPG